MRIQAAKCAVSLGPLFLSMFYLNKTPQVCWACCSTSLRLPKAQNKKIFRPEPSRNNRAYMCLVFVSLSELGQQKVTKPFIGQSGPNPKSDESPSPGTLEVFSAVENSIGYEQPSHELRSTMRTLKRTTRYKPTILS